MKTELNFERGVPITLELPIRLNKGDQIFPLEFFTQSEAIELGMDKEYYIENEGCLCYVDFVCIRYLDGVLIQVFLTDFT